MRRTKVFGGWSKATTATLASAVTSGAWVACAFACSGFGVCGYRGDRGRAPCPGRGIRGCSSASRCLNLGSSIATPGRERICAMTNRMRELRSCGSVRAEDSNVLGYSDNEESRAATALPRAPVRQGARAEELHGRFPGAAARAHDRASAVCGGEAETGRIL